jgi:hypothetical protein
MYLTSFLCNNRLDKHGLIVAIMMTMTLDLRLAAVVQDITVTALDLLHMTVVVMNLDLRLADVIQGLHTALDLHQGFIIPLSQVLVRLEWSRFLQRITQLNNQVTIQVNIQANIQANTQVIIPVIIPVIFAGLSHLLLLGVLLGLEPLTNVHIHLVMTLRAVTNHGDVRRQLLLLLGIPLQLIPVTDGHMVHPVVIVLSVTVVIAL